MSCKLEIIKNGFGLITKVFGKIFVCMHAMFVLHLTIVINLDQPLNVKTFLRSMASKPSHMEALCMSYIKDLMAKITKQPTIICNVMEDSDQHLYY